MEELCGIYKITNPIGEIYIGQSVEILRRLGDYSRCQNVDKQPKLYKSILIYGWEAHIAEIWELCVEKDLNRVERYWQDYYDVLGNRGLNCKLTKADDKSGRLSEKTKKKISIAHKGKTFSKETKLKMALAKNRPILQYDIEGNFIREYESITQAAKLLCSEGERILHNCRNGIGTVLSKKRKRCYGYIWKYK